jgi:WD40 repeat protein
VTAARTVAFDPTGVQIHCGFDTMIRTFDITRPGRQCIERKLKHPAISELSQPGIVSSIAVNPSLRNLMAVGTYLKTVGLYNNEDSSVICILEGHMGGVTQVMFSPDGSKMFSGGRRVCEV